MNLSDYPEKLLSLSVYANVGTHPLIKTFENVMYALNKSDKEACVRNYCAFCRMLYESDTAGNFTEFIKNLIRYDMNIYAKRACEGTLDTLSQCQIQAAENDIRTLTELSEIPCSTLTQSIRDAFSIEYLPQYESTTTSETDTIRTYRNFYRTNGVGMFARYRAFIFDRSSGILPVAHPDPIRLHALKEYEYERSAVKDNTLSLIEGRPYNNVLLYGDRGTGKSSTVKAILNEYCDRKLRLIELDKECLTALGKLISEISEIPMKFIVFIDDLSFNENDAAFGILKAALEGSISVRPENTAIYATTNRRHIIKETFSQREGSEIHASDTIDEHMSLSDRFGLTITFSKPQKEEYLKIARAIAEERKMRITLTQFDQGAEQFALENGGRSPRIARQYVDTLEAGNKAGKIK